MMKRFKDDFSQDQSPTTMAPNQDDHKKLNQYISDYIKDWNLETMKKLFDNDTNLKIKFRQ